MTSKPLRLKFNSLDVLDALGGDLNAVALLEALRQVAGPWAASWGWGWNRGTMQFSRPAGHVATEALAREYTRAAVHSLSHLARARMAVNALAR